MSSLKPLGRHVNWLFKNKLTLQYVLKYQKNFFAYKNKMWLEILSISLTTVTNLYVCGVNYCVLFLYYQLLLSYSLFILQTVLHFFYMFSSFQFNNLLISHQGVFQKNLYWSFEFTFSSLHGLSISRKLLTIYTSKSFIFGASSNFVTLFFFTYKLNYFYRFFHKFSSYIVRKL